MEYVSAEWVDVADGKALKAIGDDGREYFIGGIDSDVPPWPQFLEEHGVAAITGTSPAPKEE